MDGCQHALDTIQRIERENQHIINVQRETIRFKNITIGHIRLVNHELREANRAMRDELARLETENAHLTNIIRRTRRDGMNYEAGARRVA
jgi:hypothetical protein